MYFYLYFTCEYVHDTLPLRQNSHVMLLYSRSDTNVFNLISIHNKENEDITIIYYIYKNTHNCSNSYKVLENEI